MVRRRTPSQGGGPAYTYGTNVKDIATFTPASIEGLVFWIKADKRFLRTQTIQDYANNQLFDVKEKLLKLFKVELKSVVITEIISDTPTPNSLIRLENPLAILNAFPQLRTDRDKLATIDISNLKDPQTLEPQHVSLVCSVPIILPNEFSSYTISHGVLMKYIDLTNQIVLSANYVENPTTTLLDSPPDQFAIAVPTAEFSEIIIYDRVLKPNEQRALEGYIAYKKNEQYNLPAGHPYLPTMMTIPTLAKYATMMETLEEKFHQALANAEVARKDAKDSSDTYNQIVGTVTSTLADMQQLQTALSKGALKAGSSATIEQILAAVNHDWYPVPLSLQQLGFEFDKYGNVYQSLTNYTVKASDSQVFDYKAKGGAMKTQAQTEDYLHIVEQDVKSREVYTTLRETSRKISLAGKVAYSPLYIQLQSDIEIIFEAFQHQYTEMDAVNTQLQTSLDTLTAYFGPDDKWLTLVPFFDTAKADGNFIEPVLNQLLATYEFVRGQLTGGSGAYSNIRQTLFDSQLIFKSMVDLAKKSALQPILRETYIPFLKHELRAAELNFKECKRLGAAIAAASKALEEFFEKAKESKEKPDTVFPEIQPARSESRELYVRRVSKMDTDLTGIEYVETNSDGIPSTPLKPVFPKLAGWDFTKDIYHAAGQRTFRILPESGQRIVDSLSELQRPIVHTEAAALARDQANRIHVYEVAHETHDAILLPKEALPVGSYFLIYSGNAGPISVRNPGTGGNPDSIDVIGPGEGVLYIYGPSDGLPYYGRILWTPNQLPYDTLLKAPRTDRCTFVPELKMSVYVRVLEGQIIQPLLTTDGHLIEVIKHKDGNVYDIDDVFHSNPYSVVSTVQKTLAELGSPRYPKNLHMEPVRVFMDARGAASLGAALDEFGFSKVAQTPIQYINGGPKLRGAYGDIICSISGTEVKCPRIHLVTFESLFRSRFMKKVADGVYLFTTNSGVPILSPKGFGIRVPTLDQDSSPNLIFSYKENGSTHDVYLIDVELYTGGLTIEEYPYRDITVKDDIVELAFNHHQQDQQYIESLLNSYASKSLEIQQIGVEQTKAAVSAIDAAKTELTKSLEEFEKYGGVFGTLKKDIVMSVEMIELKLTEIIKDCYHTQTTTDDLIKVYTAALNEIQEFERRFKNFDDSTTVSIIIETIHEKIEANLKAHGTTANPEMEVILKSVLEKQKAYHETMAEAHELLLAKPKYVTEIRNWAQKGEHLLDTVADLLEGVEYDYNKLPGAEAQQQKNVVQETEALEEEIRALNRRISEIMSQNPGEEDSGAKTLWEQIVALQLTPVTIPERGATQNEMRLKEEVLKNLIQTTTPNIVQAEAILAQIKNHFNAMAAAALTVRFENADAKFKDLKNRWVEISGRRTAYETMNIGNKINESPTLMTDVDDILRGYLKMLHEKQLDGIEDKMEKTAALLDNMDAELQRI
jgi:hypothetical protein